MLRVAPEGKTEMHLTPVGRLILLKLTQILERIDPANAAQYDADAQALELGTPAGIAAMFELIDSDTARAGGGALDRAGLPWHAPAAGSVTRKGQGQSAGR